MNDPNDFVIEYSALTRYYGSDAVVVIPDGVTVIGSSAFSRCDGLKEVIIPEGVTIIDSRAFSQCNNLKKVILPESTEQICRSAFAHCNSLTDIRIPGGVKEIEEGSDFDYGGVFRGCSGLKSITVDPANEVYESPNNCNAIIKKKARKLVAGCKNTVIPDGVKSLAAEAFGQNDELTNIAIPDSVTYIGAAAFSGCRNLTSIHIPAKCKWGRDAFVNCNKALIRLETDQIGYNGFVFYSGDVFNGKIWAPNCSFKNIPAGLRQAAVRGFIEVCAEEPVPAERKAEYVAYLKRTKWKWQPLLKENFSLLKLFLDERLLSPKDAEDLIDAEQTQANLLLLEYRDHASAKEKSKAERAKQVELEKDLGLRAYTLADYRKRFCIGEKDGKYIIKKYKVLDPVVEIPSTIGGKPVCEIGHNAFEGCAFLISVTIPEGVTKIGCRAFAGCKGLTSVTLPDSVTVLEDRAFADCAGLCHVRVPDSVTQRMCYRAFIGCFNLRQG